MTAHHLSPTRFLFFAIGAFVVVCGTAKQAVAGLTIQLPLARTAYQTNEWIDVSVLREGDGALSPGELELAVVGEDGSRLLFRFPVEGGPRMIVEHLHVNGWLLRPGHYTLDVSADGSRVSQEIDVVSHVRRSDFKLINWGRARGKEQLSQGEENLGYNVAYAAYSRDGTDGFIRAGLDFFANCTMSGGHQMDLRLECDWSDPYVIRGGTQRVTARALIDRTRANTQGVHFYDEPGLTWHKHPATGEFTPHGVPAQIAAYRRAFGRDPIEYHKVDPQNPEHVAQWRHWALWKLGFMDAAWKDAQFGVSRVRPDFLSLTQSQYGWSAPTDGYYFNVARSLPITSGHGGYDDVGCGYYYPSFVMEMARARDHWKDCWYLPVWYGNTPADRFRLEQYMSFQANIQGLMTPPDNDPFNPEKTLATQGIVESNRLMGRLGPIFNTMPVTKPRVAVLYALSNIIHGQTRDMSANYAHSTAHWQGVMLSYLAGKMIQQPLHPLVEEDVLDGTVYDHDVLLLPSLDYLDPKVIAAVEAFIADGGVALTTSDSTIKIEGMQKLEVAPRMVDQKIIDQLMAEKKYDQLGPHTTVGKHIQAAQPVAAALRAALETEGIDPVFQCDAAGISATRQAAGDIEYLFALNATYDEQAGGRNDIRAATATISLPDDGRPVYDAVRSGAVDELTKDAGKLTGEFRFGAGQMRVFARTARPVGGVRTSTPNVVQQLVLEDEPIRVEFGASLVDDEGGLLTGSVPLEIRLIDPLGATRYEINRATRMGSFTGRLPLAANDPPGEWTLEIRELLAGTSDAVKFRYDPPARATAIAGETRRSVYFGKDPENIFRFARTYHTATIVPSGSAYSAEAAARVVDLLKPWGIQCEIKDAAAASKSRSLTEEEAQSWIGLQYAGSGQIKPGDGNTPALAGFAVQGPVILLGNPEDHAMIKFLAEQNVLPYQPNPHFLPGPNRGYVAWQRDVIGKGQESVTLIAYDEAGIEEAVGTFYEILAGIDPLTRYLQPAADKAVPAQTSPHTYPPAPIAWEARLPDRITGISAESGAIKALSHDGTLATVGPQGEIRDRQVVDNYEAAASEMAVKQDAADKAAAQERIGPSRLVKFAVPHGDRQAIAYWGGSLEVVDATGKTQSRTHLPQDITALASHGGKLLVGLADGRLLAISKD